MNKQLDSSTSAFLYQGELSELWSLSYCFQFLREKRKQRKGKLGFAEGKKEINGNGEEKRRLFHFFSFICKPYKRNLSLFYFSFSIYNKSLHFLQLSLLHYMTLTRTAEVFTSWSESDILPSNHNNGRHVFLSFFLHGVTFLLSFF